MDLSEMQTPAWRSWNSRFLLCPLALSRRKPSMVRSTFTTVGQNKKRRRSIPC